MNDKDGANIWNESDHSVEWNKIRVATISSVFMGNFVLVLSSRFGGIAGISQPQKEYTYRYFYDNIIFMLKSDGFFLLLRELNSVSSTNGPGSRHKKESERRNYKFSPNSNKTMALARWFHWIHMRNIFISSKAARDDFLFFASIRMENVSNFLMNEKGKNLWLASIQFFNWCTESIWAIIFGGRAQHRPSFCSARLKE